VIDEERIIVAIFVTTLATFVLQLVLIYWRLTA